MNRYERYTRGCTACHDAANRGINIRWSKLVVYLDPTTFALEEEPSDVVISGSYDGQALTAEHFALSTDADGNLVIELSDAGIAMVDARGTDKSYVVNLALTTVPFDGKESKEIANRVTLFGSDDEPRYWSETGTEATSSGDEAEVRKRVYDRAETAWVETLDAEMDGTGELVQPVYVYRVQFIPHGSYNNVVISPVNDELPDNLDFLGFVTADNADDAANPVAGPVDIGGDLEAAYIEDTHTVTLRQKDGTRLQAGQPIEAYLAVGVTDASVPISNVIGSTSATIVPQPRVSVDDYVWVDTNRDGIQDDGEPGIPGVVLNIEGPEGELLLDGNDQPLRATTDENGEYTFGNPARTHR